MLVEKGASSHVGVCVCNVKPNELNFEELILTVTNRQWE